MSDFEDVEDLDVRRPPQSRQERLEEMFQVVYPLMYEGSATSRMYAVDRGIKIIDMMNKTGGGDDGTERVVIGLPDLEEEDEDTTHSSATGAAD